jgi:hypothetical protein
MPFEFPDRWKAEKIEMLDTTDSLGKIFKLSNVTYFDKDDMETVHIPGKTFIAFSEFYIWHYLYDNLAQFEYLKTQIPDLNMLMFCPTSSNGGTIEEFLEDMQYLDFHNRSAEKLDPQPHKYLEDTFKIFVNQKEIHNIYKNNLKFDEVYFVNDQQRLFQKQLSELNTQFWFGVPHAFWILQNYESKAHRTRPIFDDTWWRQLGIMQMRKKLLQHLNEIDTKTPENIFLSRKDANKRYERTVKASILKIHDRVVDLEIDNMIEDFFVSKGYTPINLEGMGYLEQTKYFQNAKSIAGLVGSGFCQTLVCNPNAVVTEIMVNKRYNFTYRFIAEHVGFVLKQLDLRQLDEDKEKIAIVLEKAYGHIESLKRSKE